MISEGLNLMLYGMGTVFVFLTLLVFCTIGMSFFLNRFFASQVDKQDEPVSHPISDSKLISVIEAAITQHRQRTR